MNPLSRLDEVIVTSPGRSGCGVRNVPQTLAIFDTHFPRFPVLPGVLLLGGLVEIAMAVVGGHDSGWRLSGVARVRFNGYVRPGDRVEMAAELVSQAADEAVLKGRAEVAGRAVATVGSLTLRRASS